MALKERWQCSACDTLHDDEDSAEECCRPDVDHVWVCDGCEEVFEKRASAEAHTSKCGKASDGPRCLCGEFVSEEDERPSMVLGSLVRCAACREQIMSGATSGDAIRRKVLERAGIAT